jgi:hypothetical protein
MLPNQVRIVVAVVEAVVLMPVRLEHIEILLG